LGYLSQVDFVILLKNGEILETGTYAQLLEKKGNFAELIANSSRENDPENEDGKFPNG
jgi:ABC-type transport system involved in Fe-S cluster assembly fused permease/ATPase subunit